MIEGLSPPNPHPHQSTSRIFTSSSPFFVMWQSKALQKLRGLWENGSCVRNICGIAWSTRLPYPLCFVVWIFLIQKKKKPNQNYSSLSSGEERKHSAATRCEHFRACFSFQMHGVPSYLRLKIPCRDP